MSGEAPPTPPLAKEKSPLWEMTTIAAPVVASMTSYTLMQLADKWMVSHIGPDPVYVGAQGNGGLCAFVPIAIGQGIISVINTYVAQHFGAKSPERGPAYAWTGAWMALTYYLLILVPYAVCLPWVLSLMNGQGLTLGTTPEKAAFIALSVDYGRILVFGSIVTLLGRCLNQYFYGMHRTGVVFAGAITGNIVDFFLNPFFVFGATAAVTQIGVVDAWLQWTASVSAALGLPQMGMKGAALSTVIGTLVEMAIPLAVFLSPKFRHSYGTLKSWRPCLKHVKEIWTIGWPGGLMFGNEMVCWAIFMVAQVGHFGEKHSTAGWIAHQWMTVSFMPAVGISIAITSMVGKALGAGRPDIAEQRAWLGVKVAVTYMSLCGLAFFIFRRELVDVFIDPSTTPEDRALLIKVGATFLIATAAFQFFDGIAMTVSGALRGAGDTRWVGVVTVVLSWTVIVAGGWGMVYLLPQLGSLGPWITAALYIMLLAMLVLWRFARGKWKSIKLVGGPAMPNTH